MWHKKHSLKESCGYQEQFRTLFANIKDSPKNYNLDTNVTCSLFTTWGFTTLRWSFKITHRKRFEWNKLKSRPYVRKISTLIKKFLGFAFHNLTNFSNCTRRKVLEKLYGIFAWFHCLGTQNQQMINSGPTVLQQSVAMWRCVLKNEKKITESADAIELHWVL